MRDYGRVHATFWTSQDIRGMSETARTLAFYLLTSPHTTLIGAFRLPDGYACEDLQWTPERVSEGFIELFSKGFANRCETTKWAWILKFLEWNPPENPNQWKAARRLATQVPSQCRWNADFQRVFAKTAGDPEPSDGNPSATVTQTVSQSGTGTGTGTGVPEPPANSVKANPKKGRPKKPETSLPDDFALDADLERYVLQQIPDADPQGFLEDFRLKAQNKQWRYADWRLALMTHARNARPNSGHWAAGQYPKRGANGVRWQ